MPFANLIKGFKNFQAEHFTHESELFERLSQGQSPETLVIACSDSRIDPAILTQSKPGDIFSVRNVAAMVPAHGEDAEHGTLSAVEYAVKVLKVKHIVVMGHALCGGVRALAESAEVTEDAESFVSQWISIGAKTRHKVMKTLSQEDFDKQLRALEQATILTSLANLLTYDWLKEAVYTGYLHLHGWYFDFPNGKLLSYNPVKMEFEDILIGHGVPAVSSGLCGCGDTTLSVQKFVEQIRDESASDTGSSLPSAVTQIAACASIECIAHLETLGRLATAAF